MAQAIAASKATGELRAPVLPQVAALEALEALEALVELAAPAVSSAYNHHARPGPKRPPVQAPVVTLRRCGAARLRWQLALLAGPA